MRSNGLVACAVAELKVGSLMEVPKVERTYLLEPLHAAAIAQLPPVSTRSFSVHVLNDS